MDPNANANVQATPADPVASPQTPTANATNPVPPAGDTANAPAQPTDPGAGRTSSVSFDPEVQKFLDNQNIKTDDLQAAVAELAKRNMALRNPKNTEPQPSALEVLKGGKKTETAPATEPVQQTQSAQPAQPAQPSEPKPSHSLSDMDIANVSMFVKQSYPDVKADAEFYKAMQADGFKPVTADGEINLKSVMNYANYKQKLIDAEKAIAANQPKAGQIPQPSNTVEYAQVDRISTMDKNAAENIVMFSNRERRYGRPGHPQEKEAVAFLQDLARKGQ